MLHSEAREVKLQLLLFPTTWDFEQSEFWKKGRVLAWKRMWPFSLCPAETGHQDWLTRVVCLSSVIGFRSGPVSELTIHWDNCSCCGYMNHLWYKIRDKHDRKGKDASWSILDFPVVLYDPSLWKLVFHAVLGGKKQLPTPKIGTSFGTWTTKWGYSMRGSISFEVFRNSDYFKKAKYIDIQQLQKKREAAHLFPGCCLSSSVQSISSIL